MNTKDCLSKLALYEMHGGIDSLLRTRHLSASLRTLCSHIKERWCTEVEWNKSILNPPVALRIQVEFEKRVTCEVERKLEIINMLCYLS